MSSIDHNEGTMSRVRFLEPLARIALLLGATSGLYRLAMPLVQDRYVAAILGGLVFIILAPLLLDQGRASGSRPSDDHHR